MRASLALAVAVAASACQICASWVISHDARAAHPLEWPVPCAPLDEWTEGCHTRACKRVMVDDFIDEQTSAKLISIAERGLARRPSTGGPAIVDLNTGYIRDTHGLFNMYRAEPRVTFADEEYALYRDTIEAIRRRVMHEFGLERLYFTAPTFITRLDGNATWQPQDVHDEYWHRHVDKHNTAHYDYSGLIYLNEYGVDYEGGRFFLFEKPATPESVAAGDETVEQVSARIDPREGLEGEEGEVAHEIQPRAGRLLMFTSGAENPHQVTRLTSGRRYLVAMWFSCDARREFKTFLDGRPHDRFMSSGQSGGEGAAEATQSQQPQQRRRRRRGKRVAASGPKDEL